MIRQEKYTGCTLAQKLYTEDHVTHKQVRNNGELPMYFIEGTPIQTRVRRKVAAYARVSTDHEDQLNSYEAQCDYYTTYIQANDEWEFAGVYSDMKTPSLIQFNDLRRLAGRGG